MLFAITTLFSCKLLKISMLMVEEAGVELENPIETGQLIDSEKARMGMIF